MMNYFWVVLITFSLICAIFTGNMNCFSSGILESSTSSINLIIKLMGVLCLWSGMMNIAEKSGLTSFLSNLLSPVFKILFPKSKKETQNAISMNITANLLGLGNAATPLGIEAMKRLSYENGNSEISSNNMVTFVVLNTAALRILPTTIALLRQEHGASNPFDIFLPSILTSVCALSVGLIMTRFLGRKKHLE